VKKFVPPNQVAILKAMKAAEKRVYYTIKEAAEIMSLSEIYVRRLIDIGELPSILEGRSRRVLAAAVWDRMIAKAEPRIRRQGQSPRQIPSGACGPMGRGTWCGDGRRCS
jgi:excisionase family DNA binding protein